MILSILIPVYNAEKSLHCCVDSVLSQINDNCEIILVDDGSTDSSGLICDEYARKHHRIKVIHQQNRGALLARRTAIMAAKGEYIMIPDADDYLLPGAISLILDIIASYRSDLICYNWYRIDNKTNSKSLVRQISIEINNKCRLVSIENVRWQIANSNTAGTLNAKVIRSDIIDKDVDYTSWGNRICVSNDLFQVLPIVDAAKTVVYIDKPLYCYNKVSSSITMSYKLDKLYAYIEVMKRRDFYLSKWGMDEAVRLACKARTLGAICVLLEAAYYHGRINRDKSELSHAVDTIVNNEDVTSALFAVKAAGIKLTRRIRTILMLGMSRNYQLLRVFFWIMNCRERIL